eukprot:GHUV01032593.1.p2 GENE.GHUV01032593.1~~GHUV01032593.1.p2  ORF type:complete len:191 (+),score=26.56 GHUV01032593.1:225-797(+)
MGRTSPWTFLPTTLRFTCVCALAQETTGKMATSTKLAFAAVALLAMLAVTMAQPCIECKDCKTNNCYSACQKKCPVKVDMDKCKRFGADKGRQIGQDSCGTVRKYCSGSQKPVGARRGGKVTLTQCENIAYGECQKSAKNAAGSLIPLSACRLQVLGFGGFQQCSKQQWNDFFNGEVDELCEKAVSVIDP